MSNMLTYRKFAATLAMALAFSLGIPGTLFLPPPQPAHALTVLTDLTGIVQSIIGVVKKALLVAGQIADYALQVLYYVNQYVLQPLAFIEAGKASQALTGGMLAFVSGTNETGQAQFVQNLPGTLQKAGDTAAFSFLGKFPTQSNSAFAGTVTASLQTRYLDGSSLQGFFSSNQETLPKFVRNRDAYLAGDWSQGGPGAWFALTSYGPNNPYALYASSQRQLGLSVAGAQNTQTKLLDYGKGFFSWCGAEEVDTNECNVANDFCNAGGNADPDGAAGAGAPCTKKDGTPGSVQTPGSTVTGFLSKTLELDSDKVNSMGDASTQISSLINQLATTLQQSQDVISGVGGLAGVGQSSSDRGSLVDRFNNADGKGGYAGANQCTINDKILAESATNGSAVTDRITEYQELWAEEIGPAARIAKVKVTALRDQCVASRTFAQNPGSDLYKSADFWVNEANYALYRGVFPPATSTDKYAIITIVNKADGIPGVMQATRDRIAEVTALLTKKVGEPPVCEPYINEALSLSKLTPSAEDLAEAQQAIHLENVAAVTLYTGDNNDNPANLHLVDYRGSLVAKMNLLAEIAASKIAICRTQ